LNTSSLSAQAHIVTFGHLLCLTTHVWFCLHYTSYLLFTLKSFNTENKNYCLSRHNGFQQMKRVSVKDQGSPAGVIHVHCRRINLQNIEMTWDRPNAPPHVKFYVPRNVSVSVKLCT